MSSITLLRQPRYLSLYRKLFAPGAGYWANGNDQFNVRMDSLTGCPDEVALALAEAASLAHWKSTEIHQASLSTRELVRKADQIEQTLRQANASRVLSEGRATPEQQLLAESTLGLAAGLPAPMPSSSRPTNQDSASPTEEIRQLVAKIYRETAMLYLHTVVNNGHPGELEFVHWPCLETRHQENTADSNCPVSSRCLLGVSEISNSVTLLSDLFQRLPASDYDRAIMFPMCLVGSMSDDPLLHDFLKSRCIAHNDDYVGNLYQARTYMESVWNRRAMTVSTNQRSLPIEWRLMLQQRWSYLLLM